MGKRYRKKRAQKLARKKRGFIQLHTLVIFLSAALGLIILAWCSYEMKNPFPYASVAGLILLAISAGVWVVFDKTKWVKGRHNYPDNMGGDSGGTY